jgi:hypothetical protein
LRIDYAIYKSSHNTLTGVDSYLLESESHMFLFQESSFNSEILFLKWLELRYARGLKVLPDNWTKDLSYQNYNYLNTRNLNQIGSTPLHEQFRSAKSEGVILVVPEVQRSDFQLLFKVGGHLEGIDSTMTYKGQGFFVYRL